MVDRKRSDTHQTRRRMPVAITAVGIFLFFGAAMSALAGSTLIWRGTALDRMWGLNPTAYRQLAMFGRAIGVLFLVLSGMMAAAGVGWCKHRYWGWCLAVGIVATQLVGDFVNLLRGDYVRGAIRFAIASVLLVYLLSANVKEAFG